MRYVGKVLTRREDEQPTQSQISTSILKYTAIKIAANACRDQRGAQKPQVFRTPRRQVGGIGSRLFSCSEAGSYLRLIDSCNTQLKARGPSRTCIESKEKRHTFLPRRRRRRQRQHPSRSGPGAGGAARCSCFDLL